MEDTDLFKVGEGQVWALTNQWGSDSPGKGGIDDLIKYMEDQAGFPSITKS